jgi:hypothetical protein
MKTTVLLFVSLAVFAACQAPKPTNQPEPALQPEPPRIVGGPCSYKTSFIPAKVVNIEQLSATSFDVWFEVASLYGEGLDTVSYKSEVFEGLTREQIKKSGIEPGKLFKCQLDEITKGTCTPRIRKLTTEPYR